MCCQASLSDDPQWYRCYSKSRCEHYTHIQYVAVQSSLEQQWKALCTDLDVGEKEVVELRRNLAV